MYKSGKSITQVSDILGIPKSTLRFRLKKAGALRTREEGVRLAANEGRLGSGLRGTKRVFTDEHRDKIRQSKLGKGVGVSKKPNGYIEITMGENKGRLEHVVLIEEQIGRRLAANECVHHRNHIRHDNRLCNLELMTRAEHARIHGRENCVKRNRDERGGFK